MAAVEHIPKSRLMPVYVDDEVADYTNHPTRCLSALKPFPSTSIQHLEVTNNRLTSIHECIAQFQNLKILIFRCNLIRKIEHLSTLTKLEDLSLYENRLEGPDHLYDLPALPNLKKLDLSFNDLRAIALCEGETEASWAKGLPSLEELYFVNCKLSLVEEGALKPLAGSLLELELGSNRLKNTSGVSPLVNLRKLWLGRNKITTVVGLDTLVNLTSLDLQSNRIVELTGLDGLVNLQELYLASNGIKELSPTVFQHLEKLEVLDVSRNFLETLNPATFAPLTRLRDFWCSQNLLENPRAPEVLQVAPNIETVYFEHNPFSKDASYRARLLAQLPTLIQIDATAVTNRENNPVLKSIGADDPMNPSYLPLYFCSEVLKGFGRGGSKLGCPTANLALTGSTDPDTVGAPHVNGVFFGFAQVNDQPIYPMVMSIGWNPHFADVTEKQVEVHILHQYAEDFYGETVRAVATGRVRGMEKFGSLEALIAAIENDKRVATEAVTQAPHSAYRDDPFFKRSTSDCSSAASS